MFVGANFVDIYLQIMRDRSMQSGTKLAREMKLTDWSMAGNLSNRVLWSTNQLTMYRDLTRIVAALKKHRQQCYPIEWKN